MSHWLLIPDLTMAETIQVGIIMGSDSDWPTMEHAARKLEEFGIGWEAEVVSAHRTPDKLYDYAGSARGRGWGGPTWSGSRR